MDNENRNDDNSTENINHNNRIGNRLKDFRIIKELGKGSYGTVFTVMSLIDEKIYVMKRMELNHLKEKQQRECYREVGILKKVNHPNIIKYYSSFLEKSNLYIIMEYAENGDLYSLIKHYKNHNKHFEEINIWRIAYEILNGLHYLHSNKIIHRDIKCLNLFLTKDKHVKIGDLGVSTIVSNLNAMHLTRVGTPLYLSPELVKQIPYDYKVDIWSFGCSLYHLCNLEPPFTGDNLIVLGNKIVKEKPKPIPSIYSEDLAKFIEKMLCKRAIDRPDSLTALGMIPADVKEKILNVIKNNIGIKTRPFSAIGGNNKIFNNNFNNNNRVFAVNKEEINKILDNDKKKDSENVNNNKRKNDNKKNVKDNKNNKNINNNSNNELNHILINNNNKNKDNIETNNLMKKQLLSNENLNIHTNENDKKKEIKNIFNEIKDFDKNNNIDNINYNVEGKKTENNFFRNNNLFINNNNNVPPPSSLLIFNSKNNNKKNKSIKVYATEFKNELIKMKNDNVYLKLKNKKEKNEKKQEIPIILKDNNNSDNKNNDNKNDNNNNDNNNDKNINNNNDNNNNNIHNNDNIHNNNNIKETDKILNKENNFHINNISDNINTNKENNYINDIKFPNLSPSINFNQNPQKSKTNSTRVLSAKPLRKIHKPFSSTNTRFNQNNFIENNILLKQKPLNRPLTGIRKINNNNNNNNVINININFYNIDMNQKFLTPNLKRFNNLNEENDLFKMENKYKDPFISLKEFTSSNNSNEFLFNKIIKTIEESKGIKKRLTINDLV